MSYLRIKGGTRLSGEVSISGAKNSSMPIIIASLLTQDKVTLSNVPFVSDVCDLLSILLEIGANVTVDGDARARGQRPKTIELSSPKLSSSVLSYAMTQKIRTSILLLGPLLARTGSVKISKPGGCQIGYRKIDFHIYAMKRLGATVIESPDYLEATTNGRRLKGNEIEMPGVSVGATQNAIMAATLAEGETVIQNAAIEPEIDDLIYFLSKMGAKISKIGEREILINGVDRLSGVDHMIIPDRIEAATYAILAAVTDGDIILNNVSIKSFDNINAVLSKAGIDISPYVLPRGSDGVEPLEAVRCTKRFDRFQPLEVETNPYPHFPTDLQPQLMVALALADGVSVVTENIFENRFQHVACLQKMGANIKIDGRRAIITGVPSLNSASVESTDLRAAAALVMAALCANGESVVHNIEYLDRGYCNIERNLNGCGASVARLI